MNPTAVLFQKIAEIVEAVLQRLGTVHDETTLDIMQYRIHIDIPPPRLFLCFGLKVRETQFDSQDVNTLFRINEPYHSQNEMGEEDKKNDSFRFHTMIYWI